MQDARKQQLKGSPNRDEFKRRHKDINKKFFAMDIDLALICKEPEPELLAVIDYKTSQDEITFTEVIGYNALLKRGIRVFIVQGDPVNGLFSIHQYIGGNHLKPTSKLLPVCETGSWKEFEDWEGRLRTDLSRRFKA